MKRARKGKAVIRERKLNEVKKLEECKVTRENSEQLVYLLTNKWVVGPRGLHCCVCKLSWT